MKSLLHKTKIEASYFLYNNQPLHVYFTFLLYGLPHCDSAQLSLRISYILKCLTTQIIDQVNIMEEQTPYQGKESKKLMTHIQMQQGSCSQFILVSRAKKLACFKISMHHVHTTYLGI